MKKARCAQIIGATYYKNCEKMKMKNTSGTQKRGKSSTY
jgi:hypothetical protein